jgi:hypothetical protein
MGEDLIKVIIGIMVVVIIAALFIFTGIQIRQIQSPIDIGLAFIIGGIVGIILVILAIITLFKR